MVSYFFMKTRIRIKVPHGDASDEPLQLVPTMYEINTSAWKKNVLSRAVPNYFDR